jgi:DMSO/TMAO reductase YedYZ molybdopterin-dependent catalytic subunit
MNERRVLFSISLLATCLLIAGSHRAPAFAQDAETKSSKREAAAESGTAVMQVVGEVAHPLSFSRDEFAKLPRQSVEAKGHDGVESRYEGVPLSEFIARAGVPVGKDLRGPAMALFLVVEAADGYRATFAIAELDSAFTDRVVLLADHRDGRPLSTREGPFQIIVPGEKKHARWVRQVTRLKVGRG